MEKKEPVEKKICKSCGKEKVITSFSIIGRDGYRNIRCKICVSSVLKPEDPNETKTCVSCGITKKLKSFTKSIVGNRGSLCNTCKSVGKRVPKENKEKKVSKNHPLSLGNINKNDYIKMYEFLKKAGYTLSDKEDIHEQFCKRYNLKPHTPKKKFNRYYSQKDCGII